MGTHYVSAPAAGVVLASVLSADRSPVTVYSNVEKIGNGTTEWNSLPSRQSGTYVSTHHNEFGVTL